MYIFPVTLSPNGKDAFSLVELSIVLVVLGLLTGGILTGQNLIRAAEIRSVSTDFQRFKTALYSFRNRYVGLPGDLHNASLFWAAAGGGGVGSACFTADSSGGSACNGNGDGRISYADGATPGSDVWEWGERFQVWTHLANAGLIEGNYTGKTEHATLSYVAIAGTNVPASKISNGQYDLYTTPDSTSSERFDHLRNTNTLTLMTMMGEGVLSPEEIWNMDKKFDDGLPGHGMIGTTKSSASVANCSTSDNANDAEYNFTASISNCKIYFKL